MRAAATVRTFQNAMKKLEQAGRLVHIAGTNMPEEVIYELDKIKEAIENLYNSLETDEYGFGDSKPKEV